MLPAGFLPATGAFEGATKTPVALIQIRPMFEAVCCCAIFSFHSMEKIMASAPVATGNTPAYRPLFKRVGQNELKDSHRSDFLSELAAVATIAGVSLEEVYACAIKNGQVSTDIKGLCPRWYIGVYPMPYPTSGIPKVPPAPSVKK